MAYGGFSSKTLNATPSRWVKRLLFLLIYLENATVKEMQFKRAFETFISKLYLAMGKFIVGVEANAEHFLNSSHDPKSYQAFS